MTDNSDNSTNDSYNDWSTDTVSDSYNSWTDASTDDHSIVVGMRSYDTGIGDVSLARRCGRLRRRGDTMINNQNTIVDQSFNAAGARRRLERQQRRRRVGRRLDRGRQRRATSRRTSTTRRTSRRPRAT